MPVLKLLSIFAEDGGDGAGGREVGCDLSLGVWPWGVSAVRTWWRRMLPILS